MDLGSAFGFDFSPQQYPYGNCFFVQFKQLVRTAGHLPPTLPTHGHPSAHLAGETIAPRPHHTTSSLRKAKDKILSPYLDNNRSPLSAGYVIDYEASGSNS